MIPKRFAVLGDPVAHSKSPRMHAAAYRALLLPHTYEAIRAKTEDLPALVERLRTGSFQGFNVTVPYKTRILDFVDEIDASARVMGAANTLVRTSAGRIVAHNTDTPAIGRELTTLAPERFAEDWASSRALVLGTGGAARSAIGALALVLGVGEIVVRGRSIGSEKGAHFLTEMRERLERADVPTRLSAENWGPSVATEATVATVVQATSAGMEGTESGRDVADSVAWASLSSSAIVLELIYAPPEPPFLERARSVGLRRANGCGMLARQGSLAFELWLGIPGPYATMLRALEA